MKGVKLSKIERNGGTKLIHYDTPLSQAIVWQVFRLYAAWGNYGQISPGERWLSGTKDVQSQFR